MKRIILIIVYLASLYFEIHESYAQEEKGRYDEIYQLAVNLARNREFDSAIRYFGYLLKIKPRDEKVRYLLAKAYFLNENIFQVFRTCSFSGTKDFRSRCNEIENRAKHDFPDDHKYYLAHSLFDKKKYQDSKDLLVDLINVDSGNPRFRLLLARIYQAQGDYYRAYDHFQYVKDFVDRRKRPKIQRYINTLLKNSKSLVEYVRNTTPESSSVEIDEYWQMYCLAIHLDVSLISDSKQLNSAISHIESNLQDNELKLTQRIDLLFPLIELYSLAGNASEAYRVINLAANLDINPADKSRLQFTIELLKLRHPTQKYSKLTVIQ